MITGTYILFISIAVCFLAGVITRNYSHVDRLWSILPGVWAVIWISLYPGNTRMLIAAILICLWCIRLTLNFTRRGGYNFSFSKGFYGEDYRWEILRGKIPNRFLFELFNLFFICGFQLTLIFAFTLPVYYLKDVSSPLNNVDWILFSLHLIFLIGETVSDNQQYNFQSRKIQPPYNEQQRYQLGFNTFGLWKYSRHPNYFFELGQWILVALYLLNGLGQYHLSMLGVVVLICLFVGSTIMTENITLGRYPRYAEWKKAVPAWVPFLGFFIRSKVRKKFWESLG